MKINIGELSLNLFNNENVRRKIENFRYWRFYRVQFGKVFSKKFEDKYIYLQPIKDGSILFHIVRGSFKRENPAELVFILPLNGGEKPSHYGLILLKDVGFLARKVMSVLYEF